VTHLCAEAAAVNALMNGSQHSTIRSISSEITRSLPVFAFLESGPDTFPIMYRIGRGRVANHHPLVLSMRAKPRVIATERERSQASSAGNPPTDYCGKRRQSKS
jgi:hypothetical protein